MIVVIVVIAIAVFIYGWWIEPEWYREVTYAAVLPKLEKELTLLLITDLHVGRFSSPAHYNRLTKSLSLTVERLKPQSILIGGDFIDYEQKYLPRLTEFIGELKKLGLPLYGVLGNHDYITFHDPRLLKEALERAGCTLLQNQSVVIAGMLTLVGVDDIEQAPNYPSKLKYVTQQEFVRPVETLDWLSRHDNYTPDLPRVLLSHNPDGAWLQGLTPELVLSGHTHGGQTFFLDCLARWFPKLLYSLLPRGTFRTTAGDLRANGRRTLVSRGVGGSSVPFRLGRRPEVTVIHLKPV